MKETGQMNLQFFHWKGAGLMRIFFLLILVTVLLRGCR